MLGSSLYPPPPPPPDPLLCVKGYPWPASRLTKADMVKLTELREQIGEPITQLLHEAVAAYYSMLMGDNSPDNGKRNGDSALRTQGKPAEDAHP